MNALTTVARTLLAALLALHGCASAVGPDDGSAGGGGDGGDGAALVCRAQEARGVGECGPLSGVYWDGARCGTLRGCACEGADCARPYASAELCRVARAPCMPRTCAAQDARGDERCDRSVGVFWDGVDCAFAWGCACIGADCGRPFHSLEACREQHAGCR